VPGCSGGGGIEHEVRWAARAGWRAACWPWEEGWWR